MADMFERYEDEFLELKKTIEERIRKMPGLTAVAKEDAIKTSEEDLRESDEILKSMDLTAKGSSSKTPTYSARVKEYKAEVARMRTELRKATVAFQDAVDRETLFAGARLNNLDTAMDQKERLLHTTQRAKASHQELKDAMVIAEETLGVGAEALENLDRQRDVMMRVRANLRGTFDQLGKAGGILRGMALRAVQNKLIMGVIILVLLVTAGLIVYFKWFSSSSSDSPSSPAPA